jgi:DNA-binding transcriptional LysR family regulator
MDLDIDLKSLRSFYLLSKFGSLDRAAMHLKLTPAAVSIRLKKLEDTLRVKIFEHRPNRLVLTKKGRILLGEVTHVFDAVSRLHEAVADEADQYSGKLTIILGRDLAILFSAKIAAFIKKYPRLHVTILSKSSAEAISLISAGDIDVGISRLPKIPRGLHKRTLIESKLYLIFPAMHPFANQRKISLAKIAQERLILHAIGQVTRQRVDSVFARQGVAIENFVEVGTCEAILNYVRLGVGVGFVHDNCLPVLRETRIRWQEMTAELGTMDVSIIYKKSVAITPACRALIDALTLPRA